MAGRVGTRRCRLAEAGLRGCRPGCAVGLLGARGCVRAAAAPFQSSSPGGSPCRSARPPAAPLPTGSLDVMRAEGLLPRRGRRSSSSGSSPRLAPRAVRPRPARRRHIWKRSARLLQRAGRAGGRRRAGGRAGEGAGAAGWAGRE